MTPMPNLGEPLIRMLTLPSEANLNGGVFGGWILAQLDKAAGLLGMTWSGGACMVVGIEKLGFLRPLRVGSDFRIYGEVVKVGRTSMHLRLTGWGVDPTTQDAAKVVEGTFTCVAIDADGRPQPVDVA